MINTESIPSTECAKSSLGQGDNLMTQPARHNKLKGTYIILTACLASKMAALRSPTAPRGTGCAPRLDPVLWQGTDFICSEVDNKHLARSHLAILVLLPGGLLHLHTASTLLYS